MKANEIVEIVTFQMAQDFSDEEIQTGFLTLQHFYKGYSGFKGIRYCPLTDNQWMLILDWDSRESEKKASSAMMKADATIPFKMLINPATVSKKIYTTLKLVAPLNQL